MATPIELSKQEYQALNQVIAEAHLERHVHPGYKHVDAGYKKCSRGDCPVLRRLLERMRVAYE